MIFQNNKYQYLLIDWLLNWVSVGSSGYTIQNKKYRKYVCTCCVSTDTSNKFFFTFWGAHQGWQSIVLNCGGGGGRAYKQAISCFFSFLMFCGFLIIIILCIICLKLGGLKPPAPLARPLGRTSNDCKFSFICCSSSLLVPDSPFPFDKTITVFLK